MTIQNFIDNTKMLRDIAYINENIQSASSEFFNAHSIGISTSLQSKTDPVTSQDICKKLVLDKISFDNLDFISSSLFLKFDGIQPTKSTLECILDFFKSGLSSYSYWPVSDNGLTTYIIQYKDLKFAEASFTHLLGFEFRGTKLLLSRCIDFENLSAFERGLIGNPQKETWSSKNRMFVKKTSSGLIALSHENKDWTSNDSGYFLFSSGREIGWTLHMNEALNITYHGDKSKISRQDFDHFYSMLEELRGIRDSYGNPPKWRKLPIGYR
jgi:hypothetical protein